MSRWRKAQPGKRGRPLSIADLASAIGTTQPTLKRIFDCVTRPALDVACKIEEKTNGEIRCADWCAPGALIEDPARATGGAAGEQAARAPVRRGAA